MTINENSAVLSLNGTEIKIEFLHHWEFIAVENLSDSDVKISRSENIEGRTDGVIIVPAGGSVNYSVIGGRLYLIGTGTINVMGTSSSENPFKVAGKGGGGGSGTTNYNDLQNKPQINGVEISGNKTNAEYGIIIPDTSNMVVNPNSETILTGAISASSIAAETGINVTIQTNALNSTKPVSADFNIGLVSENGPGLISFEDKTIIDGVLPAETSIPDDATDEKIPTSKAVQLYVLAKLISMGFKPKIVAELPETGQSNLLYLVPRINGITGDNIHDEYLWVNNRFELLASTGIDLSDYATIESLNSHINDKNNPHEVKPEQIKKAAIIVYSGKTVGEFKETLLNWWSSSNGTLTTYRFSGGNINWWLMNFKNDDAIIPAGSSYQLTPIVDYSPEKKYATFLFSTVINNDGSNSILKLELWNNEFTNLSRLVTITGVKGEAETEYRTGDVNISQSNIGLVFDGLSLKGKTVGKAKETIINTYLSNPDKFGVFIRVPDDIIPNWDTDDYVLKSGSLCQITPIGTVTDGLPNHKLFGRFIISDYNYLSSDTSRIYTFVVSSSTVKKLNKILTNGDIISSSITDPNFDWDTITDAGFYSIDFEGGVTSNSHGPTNASSWGFLEVIKTGNRIMQRYTDISTGCYVRLRYSSAWRNWCVLPFYQEDPDPYPNTVNTK